MVDSWRRNRKNFNNTSDVKKTGHSGKKRAWTHDDEAANHRRTPSYLLNPRNASHGSRAVQNSASSGRKRARRASEGGSFNPSKGTDRSRSWSYQRRAGPLNYHISQKESKDAESHAFSSFFTPSKKERPRNVELGLLIKKRWVGLLIGKKGGSIREILKRSNGGHIDFGDEDIVLGMNVGSEKLEECPWPSFEQEKYTICAISGTKKQATEAAKLVAKLIGTTAQSPNYKLEFLIPEEYCGLFIGKRGANMKDMQGRGKECVSMRLRDSRVSLGDTEVSVCTIFGEAENALKAIERAANWLGDISVKVQMDRDAARENQRIPTELPRQDPYPPPEYHPPYANDARQMGSGPLPYREDDLDIPVSDYRNVPVRSRTTVNAPYQRDDLFFY